MESYLGHIAERQNSIMSADETGIFSMHPLGTQEAPLVDSFDNKENSSETIEPNSHSQPVNPTLSKTDIPKKISPTEISKEYVIQTPAIETSYISRHINRTSTNQPNGRQEDFYSSTAKIPPKKSGEVFQSEALQPSITPQQGKEFHEQKIPASFIFENKIDEEIPSFQGITYKTTPLFQSENHRIPDNKSVNNEILPILPVNRTEKMVSPEKLQTNAPKLIIGKINVEIISATKPQIVNKIERVITEKNTASLPVKSRFIFGLDQL